MELFYELVKCPQIVITNKHTESTCSAVPCSIANQPKLNNSRQGEGPPTHFSGRYSHSRGSISVRAGLDLKAISDTSQLLPGALPPGPAAACPHGGLQLGDWLPRRKQKLRVLVRPGLRSPRTSLSGSPCSEQVTQAMSLKRMENRPYPLTGRAACAQTA